MLFYYNLFGHANRDVIFYKIEVYILRSGSLNVNGCARILLTKLEIHGRAPFMDETTQYDMPINKHASNTI